MPLLVPQAEVESAAALAAPLPLELLDTVTRQP